MTAGTLVSGLCIGHDGWRNGSALSRRKSFNEARTGGVPAVGCPAGGAAAGVAAAGVEGESAQNQPIIVVLTVYGVERILFWQSYYVKLGNANKYR